MINTRNVKYKLGWGDTRWPDIPHGSWFKELEKDGGMVMGYKVSQVEWIKYMKVGKHWIMWDSVSLTGYNFRR